MKPLATVKVALCTLCQATFASAQAAPEPLPEPASPPPSADTAPPAPAPPPPAAESTAGPAPAPTPAPAPAPAPAPPPVYAPPAYAPPPPQADHRAEAPRPREHWGFYFGLRAGPSYFSATSSFEGDSGEESRSFYGPSSAYFAALGGTLKKTPIVLGGTLGMHRVHSLSGTDENDNPMDLEGTSFSLISVGFLCDVYFARAGGWHALGVVGISQMSVDRPNGEYDDDPSGFFFTAGVGHEWWVGDAVSLGVLGKLDFHALEVNESQAAQADLTVLVPGLDLTLTVN